MKKSKFTESRIVFVLKQAETGVAVGWKLQRDLRYFEANGAEHNERAWAARVGPMLEFLFPGK